MEFFNGEFKTCGDDVLKWAGWMCMWALRQLRKTQTNDWAMGVWRTTSGDSPICSTMSGGKTRDAKARRKMSENSLSRPPMPIFSKFQSGLMMDWRESRVFAFPERDDVKTEEKQSHMPNNKHKLVYTAGFLQMRENVMRKKFKLKMKIIVWSEIGIIIGIITDSFLKREINNGLLQMCCALHYTLCIKFKPQCKGSRPFKRESQTKYGKAAPLWIDRELRSAGSSHSILFLIIIITYNEKKSFRGRPAILDVCCRHSPIRFRGEFSPFSKITWLFANSRPVVIWEK